MINSSVKNKDGNWVPIIEEPYYYILGIVKCTKCGKIFIGKEMYNRHYAWKHILNY